MYHFQGNCWKFHDMRVDPIIRKSDQTQISPYKYEQIIKQTSEEN